jgi:DUF971 family protein
VNDKGPWPTELRLGAGGHALSVSFEDGSRFVLPAEYLRIASPSAEVRGHTPAQRRTVGGKRTVAIRAVDPVGTYAVRLGFDDGHDTGLYTWAYLYELGRDHDPRWHAYLAALAEKGLDRDRPGIV